MAPCTVISVQEVLGHVLGRQTRGAGPGWACAGMLGSRLAGAAARPGGCQDAPAEPAGSAIGGGPRLRRWAYPSCGDSLTLPRGLSAVGQRWVSSPGGGRLLRRRARCGGGGPRGRGRLASPIASVVRARAGSRGCGCSTCGGLLTASAIRRRTSSSVREGRSARGGAAPADSVSCRPSPGASCRVCTVRSSTTLWLTQWKAAGRRPGGGATVPRAALTTAHAANACAWARKVRYPWFSPP